MISISLQSIVRRGLGLFATAALFLVASASAQERSFTLQGSTLRLQDLSSEAEVFFQSMRYNRASNVWNLEVTVWNKGTRDINGPVILSIDGITGTTGPVGADGLDGGSPGKPFYDLTGLAQNGLLAPGQTSRPRTLTLAFGAGSPAITPKVFGSRPTFSPLVLARSINEAGVALGGVAAEHAGIVDTNGFITEARSGLITLPGETITWKFSKTNHLTSWRTFSSGTNPVVFAPGPRLTAKSTNTVVIGVASGGSVADAAAGISVAYEPGSFTTEAPVTLTPLSGQGLPGLLPMGWSPLQAFWLETGLAQARVATASIKPWAPVSTNETAVFARWNDEPAGWVVVQTLPGAGSNWLGLTIDRPGSYALVVGDVTPLPPPAAAVGAILSGVSTSGLNVGAWTAAGRMNPPSRAASRNPDLVTAQTELTFTNSAGLLPSGATFFCDLTEVYQLRTGSRRLMPGRDGFFVAYQRGPLASVGALQASVPIRPSLLLPGDELAEAILRVDVLAPDEFRGGVLATNGGQIAQGDLRVVAGLGSLTRDQAAVVRSVAPTNFSELAVNGFSLLGGFELGVGDIGDGRRLALQGTVPLTNGLAVLARVLNEKGEYGLEPLERFTTDASGKLTSLELNSADRLPGLDGSGQFVLVGASSSQFLLDGLAQDGASLPTAGLAVRASGTPWLVFSRAGGLFRLLSPVGAATVRARNLLTTDEGESVVPVPNGSVVIPVSVSVAKTGPKLIAALPSNGATRVSRVTSVQLEFSKPLNPASLISDIRLVTTNGTVVPASVTLSVRGSEVSLTPLAQLDAGTTYEAVVGDTVRDLFGNVVEGSKRVRFSTIPLTVRDTRAELIIYEPGATNIPPAVLSRIPAYVPGSDRESIVVQGTPGAAEGRVPVVLANESTGETSTILSKEDGSFVSLIRGTEDDFVSATFINVNGTRNYVPVSRQVFDNGFIGLYPQGGILEARSEGLPPAEVVLQPETIKTKTQFRITSVSLASIQASLKGVQPEEAKIVGQGLKVEIRGERASGGSDVEITVDPAALGLPVGVAPEDGAYALAMVREIDGQKVFQVVDRMKYKDGKLYTNTDPFAGWGESIDAIRSFLPGSEIFDFIMLPLMFGSRPITVSGRVVEAPTIPDGIPGGNALASLVFDHISQGKAKVLPGAFVTLNIAGQNNGLAGRVRPGMVYATSDAKGVYALVAPSGSSDGFAAGYVVRGSHPRFSEKPTEPVVLQLDFSVGGFLRKDLVFRKPLDFLMPPRVNVAHSPLYPAPMQECVVQVNSSHGASVPPTITVTKRSVTSAPGVNATIDDVVIKNEVLEVIGNRRRWTGTLVASKVLNLTLEIASASGVPGSALAATNRYAISFGGFEEPPVSTIPPSDPNDAVGPMVITSFPAEGERLDESSTIRLLFNEPIDGGALSSGSSGVTLSGPGFLPKPALILSSDQRELSVTMAGLAPDQQFTLSLNGSALRDLKGNPLDQKPSSVSADNFVMGFRSAVKRSINIPGIGSGGGTAISGSRLYALSRTPENALFVFDISQPGAPVQLSKTALPGYPRDLVVITNYSYSLHYFSGLRSVVTSELVAVVGGDLSVSTDEIGNVFVGGQYLRVYGMGNPAAPERLASPVVTLRPAAVTKLRWDPPNLVYHELGSDIQQVGVVNLQKFLIGFNATSDEIKSFPVQGRAGKDTNGDGDYVDVGEELPLPEKDPAEFFGKDLGFVVTPVTRRVQDFSSSGGIIGVALAEDLSTLPNTLPAYRTLNFNGQELNISRSTFPYASGARPKRVAIFDFLPVKMASGIQALAVALVSLAPDADGKAKLSVLDISLPESPRELTRIEFPAEMVEGFLQSVVLNSANMLELATTRNLILLDPLLLNEPQPSNGSQHPAISGFVPDAGSGNQTLGTGNLGLRSVNLGGRHEVVQTGPQFEFVRFPKVTDFHDSSRAPLSDDAAKELLSGTEQVPALMTARVREMSSVPSDLTPPQPSLHYHVLVRAPGGAGATLPIGLESLNRAGRPRSSLGLNFPPVKAVATTTLTKLNQDPRDCDAPVQELTAYRLSADKNSPYYNLYLSKAFVVVAEKVSKIELTSLRLAGKRDVLWSGAYVRAFIDPSIAFNPAVGLFAGTVEDSLKRIVPGAGSVIQAFDATYVMGDNPPPVGGATSMPGSFGTVSAHSGEFRTEATDLVIPGRRMPIEISRTIGGQDLYDGPFGRGWEFNYNQRLEELKPQIVPPGRTMPLVEGPTTAEDVTAESKAILFHNGEGRIVRFKHKSDTVPPEVASDPLIQDLRWQGTASSYYLPEPGSFDVLAKFRDGRYERLTPDGTRYLYGINGRLETIIDRYPDNRHILEYGRDGRLVKITDKSVTDDRYVVFGYYRFAADPDFDSVETGIDKTTDDSFEEGRIFKIKDYAGSDLEFDYDSDGALIERRGTQVSAGANSGFNGRQKLSYDYSSCDIRGIRPTSSGVPLFSVSVATSANGESVATGGNGVAGGATYTVPVENKAKDNDGLVTTANFGGRTTEFTGDKRGYPKKTTVTSGNVSATEETQFNEHGQLVFKKLPEGSAVSLVYDINNVNFRSRGNVLSKSYDPGTRGGTATSESWQYDSKYNLPSGPHVDKNGNSVTYALTADKRDIETVTYPAISAPQKFTYNSQGQVLTEELPTGIKTTFTYKSGSGFIESVSLGNNKSTYSYDGSIAGKLGRPTTVTPPENSAWTAEYDANLQLTKLSRGGFTEKRAYDEQGLLTFVEHDMGDGRKRSSTSEFDERSFLKKTTVSGIEVDGTPTDMVYEYTPDELSRIKQIVHPGGTIQAFKYDGQGNTTEMTLGVYKEEYKHDLHGNVTELKIGGQIVQTWEFDGFDRPKTVTKKAAGGDEVQVNTYHAGGELKKTTIEDPLYGFVFEKNVSHIDPLGRPKTVEFPSTLISGTYSYDYAAGSFSTVGPSQTTKSTWDSAGYATGFSDAINTFVQTPTANGKVKQIRRQEDGATYTTDFGYDSLDNAQSQTDGLGQMLTYEANTDGSFKKITNQRNNDWNQTFSSLGELLTRNRKDGLKFSFKHNPRREASFSGSPTKGFGFGYDSSYRLQTKTQPNGEPITFSAFDGRNLPKTVQLPGGGSMSLEYDLQGRVTKKTTVFSGVNYVATFKYDALDRVRETSYNAGGGNAATATFDYDLAGPLTKARFQEDGGDFTVKYTYRNDGTRKGIDYPSGESVIEDRDGSGRLTGIKVGSNDVMKVTAWQGSSNPKTLTLGTSISLANSYDARERLESSRYTGGGSQVLAHLRYRYDLANNVEVRQQLHHGFRADVFSYDNGERVVGANMGALPPITGATVRPEGSYSPTLGFGPGVYSRSFTYDSSGNDYLTAINGNAAFGATIPPMASSFSGHDSYSHATTVNGQSRGGPDGMGNVKKTPLQTRSFSLSTPIPMNGDLVHDALGRLSTITLTNGFVIENRYQPSGLRYLKRVLNGASEVSRTWFVYDTETRLIEEYTAAAGGSPEISARYYYFDHDAPVAADIRNPGTGNLDRYFYLMDHNGSVVAVANAAGVVVERVQYDVFGQPTIQPADGLRPQIASIVRGVGNEIIVLLTETVVPPFTDPGPGTGIQTPAADLSSAISFVQVNPIGPLGGTLRFDESSSGLDFGRTFRFQPSITLTGLVTVTLGAGKVSDEWGNRNLAHSITLDFSSNAPNGVLFDTSNVTFTAPSPVSVSAVRSPFLFQGQYFDYETGLSYMRARFYDPFTGQFLEPDPMGYEDSVNLYAGLANNPVSLRDPTGLRANPSRAIANSARRTAGEAGSHLAAKGLTEIEVNAIGNVLARRRQNVRMSIRSFGDKAAARRVHASSGMPNKPAFEKGKTGADATRIAESPSGNKYQVTSDLDILHVEIDGRMASNKEVQQLVGDINREYNKLLRASPMGKNPDFKANPPFQHGAHTGMAELYGKQFLGHEVDSKYLAKVGHPGESFTITSSAPGGGRRFSSYDTPHWQTQADLKQAEGVLKGRQRDMGHSPTGWPAAIDADTGNINPAKAWDKWSYEKPPGAWRNH